MVPLHQTAQGLRPCGMALYDMLADLSAELNDKPVPALTRHAVNFADGSDGLRGKVWRERGHLLQEAGEGMSVVTADVPVVERYHVVGDPPVEEGLLLARAGSSVHRRQEWRARASKQQERRRTIACREPPSWGSGLMRNFRTVALVR